MPYTLLLADDSVTIQRVIELTFADEDVTVVAVGDGDQAIERLEASPPPDIVLADIGMPGRNGYEVAQYVRRSPKLAHIPVMLLTGAFEPVDQARADDAGCDGVLAKPFEPQLVIGRVKELLSRPQRGQDASSSRQDSGGASEAAPTEQPTSPPGSAADYFKWPTAVAQEPAAPMERKQGGVAPIPQLDDYFDRLDAAFSKAPSASTAAPPVEPLPSAAAVAHHSDPDWFRKTGDTGSSEPWHPPAPRADVVPDVPASYASPPPGTHASFPLE
ncbi:MAG: response regulator, partial [Vicinamibacterales bacterium]